MERIPVAIGDVIRTTPLLRKLRAVYPHAQVWWLTLTPEVVPQSVDVVLPFTPQSLVALQAMRFEGTSRQRRTAPKELMEAISVLFEQKFGEGK